LTEPTLICCGPDSPPRGITSKYNRRVYLDSFPNRNVFLKIENISSALYRELPDLALDMLEVGAYVYCADQTIKRGGDKLRGDGRDWRRSFVFHIPVRNPDLWNSKSVNESLRNTLGFLSDDHYELEFIELKREIPQSLYFDFDHGQPWFKADAVMLYSGGLDSLAGAIERIVNLEQKVALVSHRPVATIGKRQRDLLKDLSNSIHTKDRFLHIPVWANKESGLTRDTNQRARSFLYTMLGAVVAMMHKLNKVFFYENGIVSINLPISEQVVGARATRSTHPKVLNGFSELLTNLLGYQFDVENPFLWKTKSDIVSVIKDAGLSNLIKHSISCGHIRSSTKLITHCGVCSQCIERRLAILHNTLDDEDPEVMYEISLFTDSIEKPSDRMMVESYINHAISLDNLSAVDLFGKYGELMRVVNQVGLKSSEAAERLLELHRRYGNQVCNVIRNQIRISDDKILRKKVNPKSLLAMLIKQPEQKKLKPNRQLTFPTPEGTKWEDVNIEIKSNDSVRIRVKDIVKTYSALDMGFRDQRKGDLLNLQWDLLVKFAETSGVMSWASPHAKRGAYKNVQLLKNILRNFFGINDQPIMNYKKRIGYVARFNIKDSRPASREFSNYRKSK